MNAGILLVLFFIAGLYASVGHGGASGYLAVMAIYQFSPEVMKPTALILNLFVAGLSFYQFYRNGYFRGRLFGLFAISSIPAAFLGGMIQLDPALYKRALGILLIFAVLRMTGALGGFQSSGKVKPNKDLALWIGLIIGLFSGIIGIGGGIILSPVILLLGWADVKGTAAVSALFIWINSLAGLAGSMTTGFVFTSELIPFITVTLVGGAIGGYLGSFRSNDQFLKYTLSAVLIMACFKLTLW